MHSQVLFAPWRLEYLKTIGPKEPERCFLCTAAEATPDRQRELLVLWKTPLTVVVMNRFPYASGHLLIAPLAHKGELELLSEEEAMDLHRQTTEAVSLLRQAVSAQGFNIGVNLGRIAGAGVPGHLHQHVVPRWGGDVNYISVIGDLRVVPTALEQMYDELIRCRSIIDNKAADGIGGAAPTVES
jgi:ATP adenylyltransferase